MIDKTRLEAEKQRNKFVVVHDYLDGTYRLLYTGDNQYRALDQYYSFSGTARMFKDSAEVKPR